jgi:hypothetical protein
MDNASIEVYGTTIRSSQGPRRLQLLQPLYYEPSAMDLYRILQPVSFVGRRPIAYSRMRQDTARRPPGEWVAE